MLAILREQARFQPSRIAEQLQVGAVKSLPRLQVDVTSQERLHLSENKGSLVLTGSNCSP
jgi:hypothetical protein